jgi:glycosyltransferase involved in cell wall biosynthesis
MLRTLAYLVREANANAATRAASLADLGPLPPDRATTDQRIAAAVRYLCEAQDASPKGGVSYGFDLRTGWAPPYPETTGYIVTTLIDCADALAAHQLMTSPDDLRQRASRLVDWLLSIQMESGAIQGGTTDVAPFGTVFNTGQVLDGWCRFHRDQPDRAVLAAIDRSARWMVSLQDDDGCWRKGLSPLVHQNPATYNARSAMALYEAGVILDNARVRAAALRNFDWVLTQQQDSGWFANNGLYDNIRPLTHAIGYTMEALEHMWRAVHDERYLNAVIRASRPLIAQVRPNGYLAARFDRNWKAWAKSNCLTGSCQLALVWYRLAKTVDDSVYRQTAARVMGFVRRTQEFGWPEVDAEGRSGVRPSMGAIGGSYPVFGRYEPYSYPNWATKFFLDAMLAGRSLAEKAKPAEPDAPPVIAWPPAPPQADDPAPARGLSVAYVVEAYPTFLVNEILALRALGADVTLMSAFRPQSEPDPEREKLREEALYFPAGYRGVVRENLRNLWRNPSVTVSTGMQLARQGEWIRMMSLAGWLAGEVRRRGITHVHATFGTRTTVLAYAVSRLAGVPFSFTTHAYDVFRPNPTLGWKTRAACFMRTISQFNRSFMTHRYPDVDASKVEVGYLGVDNAGCPTRPSPKEPSVPFRLLAVGDLIPEKGHRYLIDACRRLRARGVSVACDILGHGPIHAELSAQIASGGLEGAVRLLGRADHAQVHAALGQADAFVLACADNRAAGYHVDGIPVAIMEAMADGVPVVSTRVSGIPELVEDGVSGTLVPEKNPAALADAIQRIIEDASLRERLGAGGAARTKSRFDLMANTAALARRMASCSTARTVQGRAEAGRARD